MLVNDLGSGRKHRLWGVKCSWAARHEQRNPGPDRISARANDPHGCIHLIGMEFSVYPKVRVLERDGEIFKVDATGGGEGCVKRERLAQFRSDWVSESYGASSIGISSPLSFSK